MVGREYASQVLELARTAVDEQYAQICRIASEIFKSMKEGGVLHVFGCGHSHMFMEECFYRAGGLVPVNPLFETSTMLHEGAVKSSLIERMTGYAPLVLGNYDVRAGEVMLIFSTSGINAFPIEMALAAREKGLITVGFTSMNYRDAASRHPSGEKLCEVVDFVINNHASYGDAMVSYPNSGVNAVPGSTILSMTLLNTIIAEVLAYYDQAGLPLPIFISGNVEGGLERNKALIDQYKSRVKAL
ncbi:MAG: SIS domain-containing protein [Oscillospiraceae bacterium]|nr:SIS domain-containing protein [Oscillospiraceae bacterium]